MNEENFSADYVLKKFKVRVKTLQDFEKGKYACPKCGYDTDNVDEFYNEDSDLYCPMCQKFIGMVKKNR